MMNKYTLLGLCALGLAACADLSSFTAVDSNAPVQTKMKACMVAEANTRFQAGTLFNDTIKNTASDLVSTCMKKLMLQSAGISEESQSTAQSIITNLKNMSTSN